MVSGRSRASANRRRIKDISTGDTCTSRNRSDSHPIHNRSNRLRRRLSDNTVARALRRAASKKRAELEGCGRWVGGGGVRGEGGGGGRGVKW